MPRYFLTNNEHKKTTLTLQSGGQNAVSIEKNTAHSRNPLLDQLEIIAEAIGGLLEGKSSFSQSELSGPHKADDTYAQNKVRRVIATVSQMFTNVTSRRPPKERAPPATFYKKITYFTIVGFSSPDEGQNTHTIASGHAKAYIKPTKVHLQAYPIIPTFASLNIEKNTTENAVATTSSPALRTTFSL